MRKKIWNELVKKNYSGMWERFESILLRFEMKIFDIKETLKRGGVFAAVVAKFSPSVQ